MVTLDVKNLTIGYEKPLIHDINVICRSPCILLVLGPNGVGKTTFLKTLAGLVKPYTGKIYVNGIEITGRSELAGRFIDYVPQLTISTSGFPITAWEFVEFSLMLHLRKINKKVSKHEIAETIKEAFNSVGLDKGLWYKNIWKLSGGERQRLLIARALANNQPIILLDEPLSSIDPEGKVEITRIISNLKKDRIIIATCHDPEIFLDIVDDIMVFGKGIYYVGKPMEVLNVKILEKIYGDAIIKLKEHIHIYDHHN